MTPPDKRIPLSIISTALRDLVYTDRLIPQSVGASRFSWHIQDATYLTYVGSVVRHGTTYITNQAELLATIAFMIDQTKTSVIRFDETFGRYLSPLRFVNCTRTEYVLAHLAALRITMVVGNIDYSFQLGQLLHDHNGLPYFQIGPELLAACEGIYANCSFADYDRLSDPLARRMYRAFARQELSFSTPYTAEELSRTLRLYRPSELGKPDVMELLPMYQVRERLFRIQNDLIMAGFISVISEDQGHGKAALAFLPGEVTIPNWSR